ncbi:hypothetical protein [Hyalangium sp.]|uniref:hypothetical protein n=1 Tax=Hyalangium sp. TaxID=2028555 RepID=UPI002D2BC911|nr:hypothetical protein [Hyalangium sp.]HYH97736.1 hypothetical protein [Hyalangium sp.]
MATLPHRMGQFYNYVVDRKLAEIAGYKNAQDYFSQNLRDMSQAALKMYGAVAANFSEPVSRRFGVTCLSLLLTYKEVADLEVNHEEPGGTVIEVPGENGAATSTAFSHCSVEDMRKAIQRKRKPSSSKPLPTEDLALADQVREAVMGRFPKGVPVRVQLRNHQGKAVLDFKGIPVAQLIEALMAHLPSVPQVRSVEKAPHVS